MNNGSALRGFRFEEEEANLLHRTLARISDFRHVGWDVGIRVMERFSGHRRGDSSDFRLRATARDLLAGKGQIVKDEWEALSNAVQRAGSYPAREEASRAVHAVVDALREKVPPDLLRPLSAYLKGNQETGSSGAGRAVRSSDRDS